MVGLNVHLWRGFSAFELFPRLRPIRRTINQPNASPLLEMPQAAVEPSLQWIREMLQSEAIVLRPGVQMDFPVYSRSCRRNIPMISPFWSISCNQLFSLEIVLIDLTSSFGPVSMLCFWVRMQNWIPSFWLGGDSIWLSGTESLGAIKGWVRDMFQCWSPNWKNSQSYSVMGLNLNPAKEKSDFVLKVILPLGRAIQTARRDER